MSIQLLLVFILILLAISLSVVAVYVVIVLKEFRQSLKKVNNILDETHSLSSLISSPKKIIPIASKIMQNVKSASSISSIADFDGETTKKGKNK